MHRAYGLHGKVRHYCENDKLLPILFDELRKATEFEVRYDGIRLADVLEVKISKNVFPEHLLRKFPKRISGYVTSCRLDMVVVGDETNDCFLLKISEIASYMQPKHTLGKIVVNMMDRKRVRYEYYDRDPPFI